MRPAIVETIERLCRSEWFAHVGEPIFDQRVRTLRNWKQAIEHCSSLTWENLQLEMSNRLREKLLSAAKDRLRAWNDIAREIKPVIEPLVKEKCAGVMKAHNLPDEFEASVRWDMLGVALEAEFQDVVPPSFFAGNAYWYTVGHFPCGWDGVPLEKGGHLIVF